MRIVVKTKDKEYQKILHGYIPYIKRMFVSLSKGYKFKLPEEIILRPLRKYKKAHYSSWTFGRAGYSPETGWYISMNIELCRLLDRELDTLAHEVAHIAEAIMTGRWTHGELFEKLYKSARKHLGL
ncbi:MAG: hypothetical protein GXO99_07615 [Nitrospirae bacterium]|nr:hypothetical protein [Nitrospirota bacterium]